jgi:hypothetical protein
MWSSLCRSPAAADRQLQAAKMYPFLAWRLKSKLQLWTGYTARKGPSHLFQLPRAAGQYLVCR